MMVRQPFFASAIAVAAPMPVAEPVTMQTALFSSMGLDSFEGTAAYGTARCRASRPASTSIGRGSLQDPIAECVDEGGTRWRSLVVHLVTLPGKDDQLLVGHVQQREQVLGSASRRDDIELTVQHQARCANGAGRCAQL